MAPTASIQYAVSLFRLCGKLVPDMVEVKSAKSSSDSPATSPTSDDKPRTYAGCLKDVQSPDAVHHHVVDDTQFASLLYHYEHVPLNHAQDGAFKIGPGDAAGCYRFRTLDCELNLTTPENGKTGDPDSEGITVKLAGHEVSALQLTEGPQLCSDALFTSHLPSSTSKLSFQVNINDFSANSNALLPGIYFVILHNRDQFSTSDSSSMARFMLLKDLAFQARTEFFRVDRPKVTVVAPSSGNVQHCREPVVANLSNCMHGAERVSPGFQGATAAASSEADGNASPPTPPHSATADDHSDQSPEQRMPTLESEDIPEHRRDTIVLQRLDWKRVNCANSPSQSSQRHQDLPRKSLVTAVAGFAHNNYTLDSDIDQHASLQYMPFFGEDHLSNILHQPKTRLWSARVENLSTSDESPYVHRCEVSITTESTGVPHCGEWVRKMHKPGYYAVVLRDSAVHKAMSPHDEPFLSMRVIRVGLPLEVNGDPAQQEDFCSAALQQHDVRQQQLFFESLLSTFSDSSKADDNDPHVDASHRLWLNQSVVKVSAEQAIVSFDGELSPQIPGLYRLVRCVNGIPIAVSGHFNVWYVCLLLIVCFTCRFRRS